MNTLSLFFERVRSLMPIIKAIQQAGGTCYLVGGSVRDLVMDLDSKDTDIEVRIRDMK